MHWNDPYAVLNLQRGSSDTVIRQAYKRASLLHHPDKSALTAQDLRRTFTIDDINEAYRQIREKEYAHLNSSVTSAESPCLFSEVVDLSDFKETELADGSLQWTRDCRCGEKGYILHAQDLELNGDADEIAVQCSGCSLWILVEYSAE